MKKLLLLLFLILASFSTFADGHHLRDFTLSDFCYEQPNVQNRSGVYYFPNKSVGITDTSICVYKDSFGQYSSKGIIVRGVFDGLWTGWTRNGEIWLESYYINGKVVPIVCRDDLLEFDKDDTYFDLYDEPLTGYNRCTDGEKANITGEIINGKREGAWSIFIHSNKKFIKANYLNGNDYKRIIKLIGIFKLPKLENLDFNHIMSFINSDKKNIENKLNYILLKNIGTAVIEKDYNKKLIKESLEIL